MHMHNVFMLLERSQYYEVPIEFAQSFPTVCLSTHYNLRTVEGSFLKYDVLLKFVRTI
jgi:hypothetical protein